DPAQDGAPRTGPHGCRRPGGEGQAVRATGIHPGSGDGRVEGSQERIEDRTSTTTDIVGREKAVRKSEQRRGPGDPRFLAAPLKALAAERELWGLNRPPAPEPDPTATIQVTRSKSLTVRQRCASCRVGVGPLDGGARPRPGPSLQSSAL